MLPVFNIFFAADERRDFSSLVTILPFSFGRNGISRFEKNAMFHYYLLFLNNNFKLSW